VRQRFGETVAEAIYLNAADFRTQLDKETRALTQVIRERKISVE
jgi:hypothetical protein